MDHDLYHTLGVDRRASQEEIKKAFRKLARAYHPDLNPNDPVAERRFREIQQAYEILGEADRRAQYDRFGIGYFRRSDGGSTKPPKDVLNDVMEAFFKRDHTSRKRGEDLKYYLTISLEEVGTGTEKVITIPREMECDDCRGTGADPGRLQGVRC